MSIKDEIIKNADGGIKESFDPELVRAFDIADQTVDKELIKPENVRLNKDKFRLSGDGIFYTIQGEGVTTGCPVVFLRLHVCNLRCTWCDAYYTWNPKAKEFWTESYELTPEEVATKIREAWECENHFTPKTVVITGGEPLLQKELIDELMQIMPDWFFEIETNGTVMPTDYMLDNVQRVLYNCSPKLDNSGNSKKSRIVPEVLTELNLARSQFKFVVMSEEDIDEVERDFVSACGLDVNKIIMMPQGVSSEEVHANAQKLVEYVKKTGYRLMTRLQCDIWGAKRGV